MKIEKVILKRDAVCRWKMEGYCGGHDLKKGQKVIKIHEFSVNGNLASIFLCQECAAEMSALLQFAALSIDP